MVLHSTSQALLFNTTVKAGLKNNIKQQLKNGNMLVNDGITAELLKAVDIRYSKSFRDCLFPKTQCQSYGTRGGSVLKKGDNILLKNYRAISLPSHV
ncbi:jg6312 [Pararge aegeria aegeria]|uniref:Jg6312 protein n=1 Tax=Pararge aegeria aegeria TaxID=348720 RepID=A0A8S4QNT7_9NEOP|nr:jg6312 [Pararge aegeria aegeria]